MSHAATNWAVTVRGISPAAKLVLWHLADRHNPDHGCFPSQERLAEDCEISRSSLNTHLRALEERGLIKRIVSRCDRTRRQLPTRYVLAFEESGYSAENRDCPSPESGHGAESRNGADPSPDSGQSRVQNLDSNPVREPVREPLEKDARALLIEDFKAKWPTTAADSQKRVDTALETLSNDQIETAIRRIPDFVAFCNQLGRKVCGGFTYLEEKRWLQLSRTGNGASVAEGGPVALRPWSREWWAVLFAYARRNALPPMFVAMSRRGPSHAVTVRGGDVPASDVIGAMRQVKADAPEARAWLAWLADNEADLAAGWLPDWVCVPPGDPPSGDQVEADRQTFAQSGGA